MKRQVTHNEMVAMLPLRWEAGGWLGDMEDRFFLSFADAWQQIMKHLSPINSTILVPNFYCPDTLALYGKYGTLVFYKTNNDLTINIQSYTEAVRLYSPGMIINYGYISSPVCDDRVRQILKASPDIIVIEDCAHRLLTKEDVIFVHQNHFYIDSIRKQTGMLGSHVMDRSQCLKKEKISRINTYKIKVTGMKFLQELINLMTYWTQSRRLHLISDAVFEALDGMIGSDAKPTSGNTVFHSLWNHLDLVKLIDYKKQLARGYLEKLKLVQHKNFYVPPLADRNLSYFPCLVYGEDNERLVEYLAARNISIGSLWDLPVKPMEGLNKSLYESVLVLPLTWKTKIEDVARVGSEIEKFFMRKK